MKFYTPMLFVLTATGCSSLPTTSNLSRFSSCEEMSSYLKGALQANDRSDEVVMAAQPQNDAAVEDKSGSAPLEEGDITKIEAGILVTKKDQSLQIYDIRNPALMKLTSTIQIPDDSWIQEIILKNKHLLVFTSAWSGSQSVTRILSYNLSTPAPKLIKSIDVSGQYNQSRVSADEKRAILVLSVYQARRYWGEPIAVSAPSSLTPEDKSQTVEAVTKNLIGEKTQDEVTEPICDCQSVSYLSDAVDPVGTSMTHIVSVTLDNRASFKQELSFLGSAPVLRATEDAFLLAIPVYETVKTQSMWGQELENTHLILARDEGGSLNAKAEVRTEGFLKEQFNMQVVGNHVYAFTSLTKISENMFSSFVPAETVLKTFRVEGGELSLVDISKGIGPNEFLFSSLFSGERAYAVTFRQTDPFYVFDLSSVESPKILGELKVPGYARQLRDISENRVLAIGRDADDLGPIKGVQVSIFDTNGSGVPVLKDRKIFGDSGTRSDAAGSGSWSIGDQSYKSYLYDQESGILLLPASATSNTIQIFNIDDVIDQQPELSGFTSYVDRVTDMDNAYLAISAGEIVSLSKKAPIRVLQNVKR